MLRLRLLVTRLGPFFDLGLGCGNRRQTILPAFDFIGQTGPVGHGRLIRRFRQGQQFLYLRLQVRFSLLGVPLRQGAVPAGLGVYLGAVQADPAKTRERVLPRHLQHLHKDGLKLLTKALPEGRQGVVIGMSVAGDRPERQRIIGRPFDLATGERPRGVAIDQQRQ